MSRRSRRQDTSGAEPDLSQYGVLAEYNRKRRFDVTPEPAGRPGRPRQRGLAFVVQKHRATALHYDVRIEHDGAMLSWAVPKGPSLDPTVKRLAMMTEPHPLDYNGFEGVIPEGEYGGGTVMIWDRGTWEPEVPDVAAALAKGDLKLTTPRHEAARLVGARSHAQRPVADDQAPRSLRVHRRRHPEAFSLRGLASDDGRDRARRRRHAAPAGARGRRRPAPRRPPHRLVPAPARVPSRVAPMLATLVDAPFHRPGWVWEEKYDGIRLVALKQGTRVRLLTRNDKDRTGDFPDVAAAVAALPAPTLVLDGEVVVFDAGGVSRFQLLQRRAAGATAAGLRRLRLPARARA